MLYTISLSVLFVIFSVQGKIPDDSKACKYGDSKCLLKIINYYINEKGKLGESEINLVKLDPLLVANFTIKQGAKSAVNVDLTFTNSYVHGFSDVKVTQVKGFNTNPVGRYELYIHAARISILGPYTIKGKILFLPIVGSGKGNMTFVQTDAKISFMGRAVNKNGETYMEPDNFKVAIRPKRIYPHLSNLFNGDKALGDSTNKFLDENWEVIFMEVKQSLEATLANVFQMVTTKVFSKYPYAKFFERQ